MERHPINLQSSLWIHLQELRDKRFEVFGQCLLIMYQIIREEQLFLRHHHPDMVIGSTLPWQGDDGEGRAAVPL